MHLAEKQLPDNQAGLNGTPCMKQCMHSLRAPGEPQLKAKDTCRHAWQLQAALSHAETVRPRLVVKERGVVLVIVAARVQVHAAHQQRQRFSGLGAALVQYVTRGATRPAAVGFPRVVTAQFRITPRPRTVVPLLKCHALG